MNLRYCVIAKSSMYCKNLNICFYFFSLYRNPYCLKRYYENNFLTLTFPKGLVFEFNKKIYTRMHNRGIKVYNAEILITTI